MQNFIRKFDSSIWKFSNFFGSFSQNGMQFPNFIECVWINLAELFDINEIHFKYVYVSHAEYVSEFDPKLSPFSIYMRRAHTQNWG